MKVLFVCTSNSCRSQMAEGWARAAGAEAYSAGTDPAGYVHPLAVQVMTEIGIDMSGQTSKMLDINMAQSMDAVVTVCGDAEEKCPVVPGVRRIHWDVPDPARATGTPEEVLNQFRAVRDDIRRRVNEFLTERTENRGSN